jgi:riboflavin synthase alpha subunit
MFSGIVQEKGSIANLQKLNEVLSIEVSCSEIL